ncbi:zinc finger CCCH domain-containing protein 18-like [Trifolium pratense]|nr:zinc finger CCCH domain-containing protein 18-like [Trifolium pratense]XP_045832107.1 zinc finger CCCH domain-containing protein 18-like [Trifolium pratense]
MDISDYTRILFDKIQKFEPDNATKIMGYLLLQDHSEQELASLASCPDHIISEVVFKAKTDLQMLAVNSTMMPISPPNVNPQQGLSHFPGLSSSSPPNFQLPSAYWNPQSASNANPEYMGMNYMDSLAELQKQTQLLSLENRLDHVNIGTRGVAVNDYNNGLVDASAVNFGGKPTKRLSHSNMSEFPLKICHYFSKGYCRHGSNCRYFHGQVPHDSFSPHMHGNNDSNEDPVMSPGSLAQIESEIIELLKQRRGNPMSIASLPMAYYDKYKKVLQAQGYLTESQRHGKSGYSLTKLLVRLNSIRLIDRPHGQHAVILAEDAPKYIQKGDSVQNISALRQIYLTFPADSTFTEEDVANYFNTFGFVEDVRIPCQQRRMFGFVTFADPETVRMILDKGNPHYVRGSRVLVKPYREKTKVVERRYQDKMEHSICCPHHFANIDSELDSIPISYGTQRSLRRQWMEEQEALELQRRRLAHAQLQFTQRPLPISPQFGCFPMDALRVPDDHFNIQSTEAPNYALNNKTKNADTDSSEGNSNEGLNLPDSPFA